MERFFVGAKIRLWRKARISDGVEVCAVDETVEVASAAYHPSAEGHMAVQIHTTDGRTIIAAGKI